MLALANTPTGDICKGIKQLEATFNRDSNWGPWKYMPLCK